MNKVNKTFSIGIPTYEASESLISTMRSIYSQSYYKKIKEILLVVDGGVLSKKVEQSIKNKKLKIIKYKNRSGQSEMINRILQNLSTDFIILTNDDVILENKAIEMFSQVLTQSNTDLLSGKEIPLEPVNFLQKILMVGYLINQELTCLWNQSNNYLSCNGRILALSRRLSQKTKIPEQLWNNDTYIYLYARLHNYNYKYEDKAICYYMIPQNFYEYLNQTIKYQLSRDENQKYFKHNIKNYYDIPFKLKLISSLRVFIKNPLLFTAYYGLFIYSRIMKIQRKNYIQGSYWQTDKSTKKLPHISFK